MTNRKNCHYRIIITEIDNETGEEKGIHDDLHDNIYYLAMDHDSDRFTEGMLNNNLLNVASMLAQSNKGMTLCRLAMVLNSETVRSVEDLLSDSIEGGIQ